MVRHECSNSDVERLPQQVQIEYLSNIRHVMLDRDGVLNDEPIDGSSFVTSSQSFRWLPGAIEGLGNLYAMGLRVSVATNQSAISRGILSELELRAIHEKLNSDAKLAGGSIEAIFYCPPGLISRPSLERQINHWRADHKRIVFTNGRFDLLLYRSLTMLSHWVTFWCLPSTVMRQYVGSKALFGRSSRSIDRTAMLSALSCVDAVTIFDEDTPMEIIKCVLPDTLVKGQDYRLAEVIGRDLVEAAVAASSLRRCFPVIQRHHFWRERGPERRTLGLACFRSVNTA
jgi:HAD superfamily hydrolase (TIGR01662 family)